MSKFGILTRHIPELMGYGQDTDFTQREPAAAADSLHSDIYQFCESHPEYKTNDYRRILKDNGIEWDYDSMSDADVSRTDARGIAGLLIGACRAERFCDGAFAEFIQNGSVIRWLKRLEELDEKETADR